MPNRELVSTHLKRKGQLICRTLSYHGCEFQVDEQGVTDEALQTYDDATLLWMRLYEQLQYNLDHANGLDLFRRKRAAKQKQVRRKVKADDDEDDGSGCCDNQKPSSDKEEDDYSESSDGSSSERDTSSDEELFVDPLENDRLPLCLPASDGAAKMTIMRYFWSKCAAQKLTNFFTFGT